MTKATEYVLGYDRYLISEVRDETRSGVLIRPREDEGPVRDRSEYDLTPREGDTVIWFDMPAGGIHNDVAMRRLSVALTTKEPMSPVEKAGWLALSEASRLGQQYAPGEIVPESWPAIARTFMLADTPEDGELINEALAELDNQLVPLPQ